MSNSSKALSENNVERFPGKNQLASGSWRELPEDLAWLDYDHYQELRAARIQATSKGESLIDLSMINSDIAPPRFCLDKLSEAIVKTQNHRYSVARGIRKLREAFVHKYSYRFGVKLSAESDVCVVNGTKDAIVHVLRVVSSPGDKVLMAAPTYPLFKSAALLNGLTPTFFRISEDEDDMFSNLVDALRKERPRVLLLNFPNNPTGVIASRDFYERLLPVVRSLDIFVINDFVYGELGFRNQYLASLLSVEGFKECAVETYSMSKAYGVPGWRIGAVLGNSNVVKNVAALKTHTDYGAFLPLQYAAAATLSLESDLVGPVIQQYQSRCRVLVDGLNGLGFKVTRPTSGACVWAELPENMGGEDPALSFSLQCLQRHKILLTPGGIFGKEFSRYVRIAAVKESDELSSLLQGLGSLLKSNMDLVSA